MQNRFLINCNRYITNIDIAIQINTAEIAKCNGQNPPVVVDGVEISKVECHKLKIAALEELKAALVSLHEYESTPRANTLDDLIDGTLTELKGLFGVFQTGNLKSFLYPKQSLLEQVNEILNKYPKGSLVRRYKYNTDDLIIDHIFKNIEKDFEEALVNRRKP